jgi:hypothetical protein
MKKPLSFYQPTMQIPDTTSGFDINNSLLIPGFRKPFDNKPVMQNLFNTQQFSQNVEDKKQADQRLKNQQLGNFLLAFSDTLRGVNPAQGVLQRQEIFQQQADERKAEEERNRILAGMSDDERKIFETYGPVAAFQYKQAQENAEITALQEKRQAQALKDAGVDERSIALFTNAGLPIDKAIEIFGPSEDQKQIDALLGAGYTPEEANAIAVGGLDPDDISELKKSPATAENVINEVNDIVAEQTKQTKVQDDYANLSQAFGPFDSAQENILNVPGRFLFGTDFAPETGAAIRDRNSLNLEVLSTLANDYEGRPNVLLLNEIKKNIPESSATSEADAYQKYSNFLDRTKTRVAYLEQGIRSESVSDATKEKYRIELIKAKSLEVKLDAAVLGLKPKGKYDDFYTNKEE